jgi:hypothetical protein
VRSPVDVPPVRLGAIVRAGGELGALWDGEVWAVKMKGDPIRFGIVGRTWRWAI